MTNQHITKIGLLGFGNVGHAVYDLLQENKSLFSQKMESTIQVKSICVRDLHKDRGSIDPGIFTLNYKSIVNDPEISIVVELMGDCPEALDAIRSALKNGVSVVTANKAILARHGRELFELANQHKCDILFEGAVAGGIPILRTLREGLAANRIEALHGIINGTSNFILSKMTNESAEYETVLKEAQRLGYAEADPSSDVMGHDTAYKLCILAMLCHGQCISPDDVFCKGITFIKSIDLAMAAQFGYVIKLLGITKHHANGIEARVHPTMVPKNNPIAHINGAYNAIQYRGDFCGEGMVYGLGAGGKPTASAVVADILELSRHLHAENKNTLGPSGFLNRALTDAKPRDILELQTCYYIRFSVVDKPNVLARITAVLGRYNISIQHLYQHGEKEDEAIPIIVFTHTALERDIRAALKEIDAMDFVTQVTKIIRIENNHEA